MNNPHEVDHCDIGDLSESDILDDEGVDVFILFADVDPKDKYAVAERKAEWVDLFGDWS